MPKFTIETPAELSFTRGGINFTFKLDGLNADMVKALLLHGIIQKVGDAAAGKSGDEAGKAMEAVSKALHEGTWGRARTSSADPLLQEIGRILLAKLPKDHEIRDLEGAEQAEALTELFGKQDEKVQATLTVAAERRIEVREEERKMRAKLKAETEELALSI